MIPFGNKVATIHTFSSRPSHVAVLFAAIGALVPGYAIAAEGDTDDNRDVIIVTGQATDYSITNQNSSTRLNLSVRETPQSVAVVTRAQIEDFHLDTVDQLLTRANGVNVERSEKDRT